MADFAAVLKELQKERDRLDQAIAALATLAASNGRMSRNGASRARRTISAAGRYRIAEAQRARWAKTKAGISSQAHASKRVMSVAARKKIAAAQRARWAKARKEKKAT